MCWLSKLFGIGKSNLELSPSDWLPRNAISAVDNNVIIDLSQLLPELSNPPKVWIPSVPEYPDPSTGSMLPNFSHEHNNILIAGADEKDHQAILNLLDIGDIAVYRIMVNSDDDSGDFTKTPKFYAIHRIIDIGSDEEGRYFLFKGDNNSVHDPYIARSYNIIWVSIGTIF